MHLQRVVGESHRHFIPGLYVLEFHLFERFADRFFPQIILTDDPQCHVQAMAGQIVEEVQTFGVLGQTIPIHIVTDGGPTDLLNLFLSSRQDCFLQLFDFPFLGQAHFYSALRAQVPGYYSISKEM